MSFILAARNEEELQVNAWNWRPTLLLLLNENLIDLEHHDRLAHTVVAQESMPTSLQRWPCDPEGRAACRPQVGCAGS
jgi:hypothetical protein